VRAGGVRGVADQQRPLPPPGRQCRDVEGGGDDNVFSRLQQSRDRIVPAGVEVEEMSLQRLLIHGAEGCRVDAMRRLGAPPHHAVVRVGAAEAVAEKSALPEGRLHPLPDRGVREHGPRHKTAKTDQAGIERLGAVRNHMRAHGRMHAVGADQKIAFGAGAVGEVGDHGLIGAVFDAHQPLLEGEFDVLAPGLVHDRFVERGAAYVDRGLAEARLHVPVDRAEPHPGLRMEIE
jgi:hypothetical protein